MTRRLTLPLLALLALSGGLRLTAQDVVLVPGTISGSISVGSAVMKQATVYASPASGSSTSTVTISPNAASAAYSLTVSVPSSGPATFNSFATIYTDEYRDYLQTTTSQVSVSAATPGQLDFNPAVGFVNASITVSGGTLSSAYVYASQNGSYAQTSATPQYGWTFPTMPGSSINLGGTAYLTDGRQINFTNQTVSVASGQTIDVSFSMTAPTNAIGGTIGFTGPKTVTLISAFASGPTYRGINQSPPPANQAYLLDGLGAGQYSVGVYAYTNNNRAYLYMPDSAFSPGRVVTVGPTPVTVNVSATQAFINSTLTLTGAPTLSPYLSSGQIQYMGQSQTPAAGGQSYAQINGAAKTFESVVAPGTWRQSLVGLNFRQSAAPYLSADLYFYDNRTASNVTLAEGETRTSAIDLALGEVTITMSVAGGQALSNPRLNSAYCTYTVGGSTLWQFYPYASSGASNVTQGQVTFVGPAGTCTVTPAMTVNGSNVALSPITLTIVPGTTQVIDVGGPTLTMTSPAAEAIVATPAVTVSGKATDDVGVDRVTVNGVNVTLTSTGNQSDGKEVQFQTTVSGLQLGPNTITTVASDAAAKNNTDARTVYYDTAAPSVVFAPADGTTTLATTITVSGTADDDAGVSKIAVNGANVSFSSTNNAAKPKEVSFITSVALVAGPNPITVRVTDISTRSASVTRMVTRETQQPTSLSVASVSAPFNGTATLSSTLMSNGGGVAGKIVRFNYGAGGQNLDAVTNSQGIASVPDVAVSGFAAGTVNSISASFAGDSGYSASAGSGQLTIVKASAAISLMGGTFTYDGLGKTATASTTPANLTGLVVSYAQNGVATGTPTNAGLYTVTATLTNANYTAPNATGTLVIGKATPTMSAAGGTFTYDGQPHPAEAVAIGIHGESLGPVALSYSGATSGPPLQFAPAVNYALGNYPMGAPVVADFDGDSKFDLAVANQSDGTVSILKGDGTGRFSPLATYTVDPYPSSIAAEDFTGDGRLDLAVASGGYSNTTRILLGNGDGTFRNGPPANGGHAANLIRALDVNRDGKVDLLTVGYYQGAVLILGNGDGTFQAPRVLGPSNKSTGGVAAGDVNGDGIVDIVVPAKLTLSNPPNDILAMFLGNADGTFQPAVSIPDSRGLDAIELADLNHDRKLDLITGSWAGLAVRLGNGDGTYGSPTYLADTDAAMWITISDVNRDNAPDILATNNDRSVIVLLGRGDGTFQAAASHAAGSATRGVSVADLDRDGALDLIVTNLASNNVSVLLQNPNRSIGSASPPIDAGSYVVVVTYAGSDNYAAANAQTTLTISPAPLTVKADDKRKIYGDANPSFTVTMTGLASGQSQANLTGALTFATTATSASSAGTYPIVPSGLASANYSISFVGGALTIDTAALTVRAEHQSRRYGDENPTFTGTIVGIRNGDPITGTYTTDATRGSAVGAYVIRPALNDANTGRLANYEITSNDGVLTIAKAPLTVTANDATREYGLTNPEFSASYSGLVAGDQPTVLGGALAFTTSASPASSVGPYALSPSGVTSGNYDIRFVDGTLSVTTASLVISADDKSRHYGGENPAFSGAVAGLRNDDPITLAFAASATTTSSVGGYVITPSAIDPRGRLANYSLSARTGTLQVTPAALTVRAIDQSRRYGAPNPAFGVVHDGLVAGDTAAALHGTLVVTTAADQRSNVGAYAIQPAGVLSPNYDITFVDGRLTITQAEAVMAIAPAGPFTYDAAPHGTTTSARGALGEDLGPITLTYNGSDGAPIAAGSYTVLASYPGGLNYAAGTITDSIVIDRAHLNVTANDVSRTYGQENPASTVSFAGLVGGESAAVLSGTLMLATSATQISGAGPYPIAPSGLWSPNYDISYRDGVLSVAPAPLTVTSRDTGREFGTPNPAFNAAFTGLVLGETPAVLRGALSFTTPASLDSPVGRYPIVPAGASSTNYRIEFRAGTLTIVDTTAPNIRLITPSQTLLRPPNHQLIPVSLAIDASDAASSFTCRVSSVSSSEPDNGLGDGDTAGDTQITGTDSVVLRAERAGNGPGRVYTIAVECRDAFKNTSRETTSVTVPRSQGK